VTVVQVGKELLVFAGSLNGLLIYDTN
jgi:hypothetical protein